MAKPVYVIDNSLLGSPVANSSLRSDKRYSLEFPVRETAHSSSNEVSNLRSIPECLPLKTFSYSSNPRYIHGTSIAKKTVESVATFENLKRNQKINDLINNGRSPTKDLPIGSIFKMSHKENSCQEYAKLLRATVPDLYKPGK